jgi:hypothetical protein
MATTASDGAPHTIVLIQRLAFQVESVTEIVEFDGPHFLPAAPGWERVADYALDWAVQHASPA